jgi:hypothetical protein
MHEISEEDIELQFLAAAPLAGQGSTGCCW